MATNDKEGATPPPNTQAAAELAKAMAEVRANAAAAATSFQKQLDIVRQLQDAMAHISGNMEKMCDPTSGAMSPDTWKKTTKEVEKNKTAVKGATSAIAKMAEVMQSKWSKAAIVMTGALTGMWQGFKNLAALTKGVVGFFGSVVSGAFNVAKAIVAIPFKMLTGLFKMAGEAGGSTELAEALEHVREQFGDLKSESASTVIDVAKGMGKLDDTGVSAWKVFGNLAQRIEAVNKLAAGMGATFQVFQKEIMDNGEAIMRYQRGLGLTDEQMASIGSTAMRMGTSVTQVENEMTKQALGMSKAFGVNAKVLSKDMGKAMQDLAHFGHLSTKEMAIAATFANKMGVSVDKLVSVMDSTKTFDQAAEGMSKLNEQFGTNIDATEIMSAQNPAEKVEILRREFAKTGKDMSKMTVQERDLIKQSSGMSDELLNAAFSAKNAGVSLDKITSKGDSLEKSTMSQTEAMHELSDSIVRMVQAGQQHGGFMSAIMKGFQSALQSSPEFLGLMRNLNIVMQEAFQFGRKLGRMFLDLFPGVKDVFGGLKELFDPAKFRKMFDGVLKAFDVFKDKGSGKMEDFMSEIKKVFSDFFDENKPAGKKVLDGFKKFGTAVAHIFGMMSKWVIEKLADIIVDITDWLKKPKLPDVSGAAAGLGSAIAGPFDGAFKALKEKLGPALLDLAKTIFEKIKDGLLHTKTGHIIIGGALAVVLAPAIMGALLSLASAGLFKSAGKLFGSLLGGGIKEGGKAGVEKGVSSLASDAIGGGKAEAGAAATAGPGPMMQAALPDKKTIESMQAASNSKVDWQKLGMFLVGMAGVIAVGLLGLWAAIELVRGYKASDIAKAVAALVGVALAMDAIAPVLLAAKFIGQMAKDNAKEIALGMVALGIGVLAVAGTAILIAKMLGDIPLGALAKGGFAMVATAMVFGIMGVVLLEAAAVGAIIVATEGIGAIAMLAGMAAMAAAVVFMAEAAKEIAKQVGTIDVAAVTKGAMVLTAVMALFAATGPILLQAGLIGTYVISSLGAGAAAMAIGMMVMRKAVVYMAETANAIVETLKESVKKPTDLAAAAGIMVGMVKLFDAAEGIILVAGLIGTYIISSFGVGGLAIYAGMKTIGKSVTYIADAATEIINKLGSFETGKVATSGTIMAAMSAFFVATGAIILEAGLIGAQIIGSFGLGGLAILAGMETIKAVSNSITDTATAIMQKLGSIPGSPEETKAKSEAFGAIVNAIAGLTNSVAGGMKGMADASAFDPNAGSNLDKIKDIMTQMMEGQNKDGTGGIKGLINTILNAMKDTTPQQIEAGKAIGSVLQATVSLIGSMTGPAQQIREETRHWWQSAETDNERAVASMKGLSDFVGNMGNAIGELVKKIGDAMKEVGGQKDKEALKEGGTAISGILGSVTQLMTSLMEPLKNLTKTDGADAAKMASQTNMLVVITSSLGSMIKGVGDAMGPLVESMKLAVQSVPDDKDFKSKLETTKNLFGAIASVSTMMKGLAEVSQGAKAGEAAKFDEWALTNSIASIGTFFQRIFVWPWYGGPAPMQAIINALSADSVTKLGSMKDNIAAVKSVFEMLASIPKAVEEFAKSTGSTTFDNNQAWNLAVQIANVSTFMRDIALGNSALPIKDMSPLWMISLALGAESVKAITGVKKNIDNLKEVFEAVSGVAKAAVDLVNIPKFDQWWTAYWIGEVGTFLMRLGVWEWNGRKGGILKYIKEGLDGCMETVPGINATAKALKDSGLVPAIEAVTAITKAVNDLDAVLAKPEKAVNIRTKLEALAKGAGLGSKGIYTVDSKAVIINVSFEVTMDAGKVEKAIIYRSNSQIRDRINLLLENNDKLSADKNFSDSNLSTRISQNSSSAEHNFSPYVG